MTTRNLFVVGMGLAWIAVAGCGQGPEVAFHKLDLQRHGWDSLTVAAAFSERLALGRTRPIEPREVIVYLFNAGYDTLYAGDGRIVPIADRELGDRERLMLEVCGRFETITVCDQEAVTASPKRLQVEHDIHYPDGSAFERGRYTLRFTVERQDDAGNWERLGRLDRAHGYLRAYVGDQAQEAVEVPFSGDQGRFNLEGLAHFDDFDYHLTSTLMDGTPAVVHFDIYAGFEGQTATLVASVEKQVREKTEEERALEVAYFARQATGAILDALELSEVGGLDVSDDRDWTFNQLTNTYRIALEIAWERRKGIFRRRRDYELRGVLEVEAGGANARFVRQAANERAARHWAFTIGEPTLSLGMLEPYVHDEEPEEPNRARREVD